MATSLPSGEIYKYTDHFLLPIDRLPREPVPDTALCTDFVWENGRVMARVLLSIRARTEGPYSDDAAFMALHGHIVRFLMRFSERLARDGDKRPSSSVNYGLELDSRRYYWKILLPEAVAIHLPQEEDSSYSRTE